jgi:hypothetical protein
MRLENIRSITLPENFPPFLNNIIWKTPACTVSMHPHLGTLLAFTNFILGAPYKHTAWIKRVTNPQSGQALSPRRPLSSSLVICQQQSRALHRSHVTHKW